MRKKILLLLVCGLTTVCSFAQTWDCGVDGNNVIATLSGGTLTISGTGAMMDFIASENLEEVNSPWFVHRTTITSLIINEEITRIGNYAFMGLSKITSVTIPKNITSIGDAAFRDCTSLFTFNYNAENCTVAGEKKLIFYETPIQTVNIGENVKFIPNNLFNRCESLTGVIIPNNVETIDYWAFGNCINLRSITIGAKCSKIGYSAFANCTKLSAITNLNPTPQNITDNKVFDGLSESRITLYVSAESEAAYKKATYTWGIFNIKIMLPQLSSLTVSAGRLDFYPNINSYDVIVPKNTDKITLTATADAGITISGDGEKMLQTGKNDFQITVSNGGESEMTYTINVFRMQEEYWIEQTKSKTIYGTGVTYEKQNVAGHQVTYNLHTENYTGNVHFQFVIDKKEEATIREWNGAVTISKEIENVQANSIYQIIVTFSNLKSCYLDITNQFRTVRHYLYYDFVASAQTGENYPVQNPERVIGVPTLFDINVNAVSSSGIDSHNIKTIAIFPNPAKDYLFIQSESPVEKVEIYNQSGVCVLKNYNPTEKLDVSDLSSGFYLARIYVAGMPINKKIIVRK